MALSRSDMIWRSFLLLIVICNAAQASKNIPKSKKDESSVATGKEAAAPSPSSSLSSADGAVDITKLGASSDGKKDSTKALLDAWKKTCEGTGKQTLLIPKGNFLTAAMDFFGPCKGEVTIQLDGNLLGSTDLNQYKGDNWIQIKKVDNIAITGAGIIDGQGPAVWAKNACDRKYDCDKLPNSLLLESVNNANVSGITLKDAKLFHLKVTDCTEVSIKDVTVSAAGDSPNTDGTHIGGSSHVTIDGATIATGDDCVSIGASNQFINVTGVTCGPGHGISIGSLGRFKDEKDVSDITIKDWALKKTDNGIRIKTYDDSAAALTASKISFQNITMEDVRNPIIINTKYCPNDMCPKLAGKKITIKDVTFKDIKGTSSNPEAVQLICSDKMPCTGMQMLNVKVEYKGKDKKTTAVCTNAKVTAQGCLDDLACVK